jgi:2-succinyl-6-hydroxy-2,4-cyclohexadiene-1-carboxylate synthase
MKMNTKMTKVNGINIRYLDVPNEGKEAIFLLPYGGALIGMWNGVIPYLKDDFRVVALDQRCHGFSDKPDECHIDDMANDLAALMDHLEIDKAYIVGSSLGADTAIALAANYPEKVIAMVLDGGLYDLVGPDSKDQILTDEAIEKARNKLKDIILKGPVKLYDSKEECLQAQKEAWEKEGVTWTDILQVQSEDEIFQDENGKFRTPQEGKDSWNFIWPLYDVRFQEYFDKITCPILWLPDETEAPNEIVQKNLKKYAKNLKYHKIVTIEGSIHAYTAVLKPEEFSKETLSFIEEVKGL